MERNGVRVSRVGLGALALFEAVFAGLLGLGISIAAWVNTSAGSVSVVNTTLRGLTFGLHPGLGAVILSTIYYFIAGLVLGYVNAGVFNLLASWAGGVEVARKEESEIVRPAGAPMRARRAEPTFGETIDRRRMDR